MAGVGTRIHPNQEDIGVYSIAFGRGIFTSKEEAEEFEKKQTALSLEEARWTDMRKKIPGMSRVPKRRAHESQSENFDEHINDMVTFIKQHFHQKECFKFVPKSNQKVRERRFLRCRCGEILNGHTGMHGKTAYIHAEKFETEKMLIPHPLKEIMSIDKRLLTIPSIFPEVDWSPQSDLRSFPTAAYGKINFINVEQIGGKKPAKYIRLSNDDKVEDLLSLMNKFWGIMEPKRPNLVISVVGGAKNFKLDGRMRDIFSSGLIKAAKTTSAWLITSGSNMGVMKAVGQAVHQGQSFCWDNDRMAHVLRCIGISPWGYVQKRFILESRDGQGKFNANYKTSNVILHGKPVPLNPDHTHFIFVDDGYRNTYEGVFEFRAKFENQISKSTAEGGLGIPVVIVVVEGGVDAIKSANMSLNHDIPIVVCLGTGRAADILAYAYLHTNTHDDVVDIKEKYRMRLEYKIFEAYGKDKWKKEETEEKLKEIINLVLECCKRRDLIIVCHMSKHEGLDLAILSVLLKAHSEVSEEQRLHQLKLALTWNRVDIAQEEIFREDVLWPSGSLHDVLNEAILQDKVEFVQLIIQQGVAMKEYLTVPTLEVLYNSKKVERHTLLYRMLFKTTRKTNDFTLADIVKLLNALMDKYDEETQSKSRIFNHKSTASSNRNLMLDRDLTDVDDDNNDYFRRPYKQLFIWALLMNRQKLAKFCWEMGDEPVTSAVAATRIYDGMERYIPSYESDLKEKIKKNKIEFETLATKVLDECHYKDPDKAMMLVERKSPSWSHMTCLQIAASADDQVFLSSVACQNSISMIWKHGIMSSWKWVLAAVLCPFLIFTHLDILNMGEQVMSNWQKFLTFYTAPVTKFSHYTLTYMMFLLLFSYMVLVDFEPYSITVIEYVTFSWVVTMFIDEIHTFIAFPSPTVYGKIRDWYDFLKLMDFSNLILTASGFFVHMFGRYQDAKIIYCFNCVIFYLHIMKVYTANSSLGPKLYMIKRMLGELKIFTMVLLVFLLAYGVASQGLLYQKRNPDWTILKDVFYFPYWQLYGEIFLDELETDTTCSSVAMGGVTGSSVATDGITTCRTFHWLVPFFLAAYLLVGNVLLLNLLIAIFSHVFDTVEQNSIEIWKYQMYFLVMEYDNKTALIPPFSICSHLYLIIKFVFRKTCCVKKWKGIQFAKRHLEYLGLFEKEMSANYLRRKKAEMMSSLEMTVNNLQKRVDELTKVIEDEIIAADQAQPIGTMAFLSESGHIQSADGQRPPDWPAQPPIKLNGTPFNAATNTNYSDQKETVDEEKHDRKKHKHKHKKKIKKNEKREKRVTDSSVERDEKSKVDGKDKKILNLDSGDYKEEPHSKNVEESILLPHQASPSTIRRRNKPNTELKLQIPQRKVVAFLESDSEAESRSRSRSPKVSPRGRPFRYNILSANTVVSDTSEDENIRSPAIFRPRYRRPRIFGESDDEDVDTYQVQHRNYKD